MASIFDSLTGSSHNRFARSSFGEIEEAIRFINGRVRPKFTRYAMPFSRMLAATTPFIDLRNRRFISLICSSVAVTDIVVDLEGYVIVLLAQEVGVGADCSRVSGSRYGIPFSVDFRGNDRIVFQVLEAGKFSPEA